MSIKDELIIKYFRLCTDKTTEEIEIYKTKMEDKKTNPKDIKMELAEEIVKTYHSEKSAAQAKQNFIEVFQNSGLPDTIPEVLGLEGDMYSVLALKAGAVESKAEWKRLVCQNAVTLEDGSEIKDIKEVAKNGVIKIGKKRFLRIRI